MPHVSLGRRSPEEIVCSLNCPIALPALIPSAGFHRIRQPRSRNTPFGRRQVNGSSNRRSARIVSVQDATRPSLESGGHGPVSSRFCRCATKQSVDSLWPGRAALPYSGLIVDLALDSDSTNASLSYAQQPSEAHCIANQSLNPRLAHSSMSLPNSWSHFPDRYSLPASASSADGLADEALTNWSLESSEIHRSNGVLPEVSHDLVMSGFAATQSIPDETIVSPSMGYQDFVRHMPSSYQRGLPRRRSRYLTQHCEGQSGPIFIPNAGALSPMERWRSSPPEAEPASMSAILDALEHTHTSNNSEKHVPPEALGARSRAFGRYRKPPSTTSDDSSASSRLSIQSSNSRSSYSRPQRKERSTRNQVRKPSRRARGPADKRRRFCCTFCCDKFKSKYDWARHESSLHLNVEAWYCAPHGTKVFSHMTRRNHCAFCNVLDPSPEHLNEHNHNACQSDSGERRSFRRKDHLMQHLRLVHHVEAVPLIDDWKIGHSVIPSRCGFCDKPLSTWEQRVEHLAEHFRDGATMSDWRGEHGFPPSIAAQVANSLPPYLIGSESHSIIPFSATNTHVRDHFSQISSRARLSAAEDQDISPDLAQVPTLPEPLSLNISPSQLSSFTEVLTLHLSRYAQEQIKRGIVPTDEMFQHESRRLLYDSDDSWNQTIADNPEWLSAFRRLHCGEGSGLASDYANGEQPLVVDSGANWNI